MDNCNANAKKSLMNSLELLNDKASMLSKLSEASSILLLKFTHPKPLPTINENYPPVMGTKGNSEIPDIIDLFNDVAGRIQIEIDAIGNNIDRVRNMVE